MALRRLIALMTGLPDDDAGLLGQGFALARGQGGRLDGLFVRRNASTGDDFLGDAFSTYGMEAVLEVLDDAAAQAGHRAREAYEAASDAAEGETVGRFIEYIGLPREALADEGRVCDLLLATKPEAEDARRRIDRIEISARHAGRPVLALPADCEPAGCFQRIAIAWDGSLQAARAVESALPLMHDADAVTLVHAGADARGAARLAAVSAYLEAHKVTAASTAIALDGRSEAEAIAAQTLALEADLLVMGGFGATGWRALGGGDTPAVLRAVNCAVLLAN